MKKNIHDHHINVNYVTAKQTFNYAKYTKNVDFKLNSINVTVVNILFINKSPEE